MRKVLPVQGGCSDKIGVFYLRVITCITWLLCLVKESLSTRVTDLCVEMALWPLPADVCKSMELSMAHESFLEAFAHQLSERSQTLQVELEDGHHRLLQLLNRLTTIQYLRAAPSFYLGGTSPPHPNTPLQKSASSLPSNVARESLWVEYL